MLKLEEEEGKFTCGCSAVVKITLKNGTYHEDVGYGVARRQPTEAKAIENSKKVCFQKNWCRRKNKKVSLETKVPNRTERSKKNPKAKKRFDFFCFFSPIFFSFFFFIFPCYFLLFPSLFSFSFIFLSFIFLDSSFRWFKESIKTIWSCFRKLFSFRNTSTKIIK